MATSFSKIKSQIEKLQKQAASIQTTVISRIKREIAQHGLTAEDLFGSSRGVTAENGRPPQRRKVPKPKNTGADKPAKFADEKGNTWHGVGKRPQWIHDVLAAGRKLEEFLVGKKKAAPELIVKAPAKTAKRKSSAKRAASSKRVATAKKAPVKKAAATAVAAKPAAKAPAGKKATRATRAAKPVNKVVSKKVPAKRTASAAPADAPVAA